MEKPKRIVTKIGNVFCVQISPQEKKYFQYIANDMLQLNSSVIRVFERTYPTDQEPKLTDVVQGKVEFYAHTVLSWGIRLEKWTKVGKVPFEEPVIDVWFMDWFIYLLAKKFHRKKDGVFGVLEMLTFRMLKMKPFHTMVMTFMSIAHYLRMKNILRKEA